MRDENIPDQFIAIGHSFGARILFAATNQFLIYETKKAHPVSSVGQSIFRPHNTHRPRLVGQYNVVESATDAVILLNPAFEASMYTELDDMTRTKEIFSPKQAPLLISISTDDDVPTGFWYPLGQWLGLARTDVEETTLGNHKPYFTHSLLPSDSTNCSKADDPENFEAVGFCLKRLPRDIRGPGGKVYNNSVQSYNPFYVAQTNFKLIQGHTGIWNDKLSDWLLHLIEDLQLRHEAAKPTPEATPYD